MRIIGLIILASCFSAIAAEIPADTHVLLRVENFVTTEEAKQGDYVYLRTVSPIIADGETVVPADSLMQGVVAQTKQSARSEREGQLTLRLETLTLPNGDVFDLTPQFEFPAKNMAEPPKKSRHTSGAVLGGSMGAMLGFAISRNMAGFPIGAGVGAAVGLAVSKLRRGQEIELYQGVAMDVVIDQTVTLQ